MHRGDAELARKRAVADVAWFIDPFGFRHELSWGLTMRPGTFKPSRPMSGFVTGAGGLGHVVLMLPDARTRRAFLIDVLGFKLSDRVDSIARVSSTAIRATTRSRSPRFPGSSACIT